MTLFYIVSTGTGMEHLRRWLPILVIQAFTLGLHVWIWRHVTRRWVRGMLMIASVWMIVVPPVAMVNDGLRIPSDTLSWVMAISLFWVVVATSIAIWVSHTAGRFSPNRRLFLTRVVVPAAAIVPVAAAGAGIVVARKIRVVQRDIAFPGLPKDLDGLRIAHLSDIHLGAFFSEADLEYAVNLANDWKAHIGVHTGDLITHYGDDVEGCLRILGKLKATDGVYGCNGNHERYAYCESSAVSIGAKYGIRILRSANETLKFGEARLNLAGFDYQRLGAKYLPKAEEHIVKGAFNLLLQHNPDVLPRAAEAGYDLTLAGHTHGGQINMDVAGTAYNIASIYTPYTRGLYHHKGSALYVSSGLGTVALPVRLGAPPEVSLLRLCAV